MLKPDCEPDFAEMTAALRALGVDSETADALSYKPLGPMAAFREGVMSGSHDGDGSIAEERGAKESAKHGVKGFV